MNSGKCQLISADYDKLSAEDGKVPHAAQSKLSFKLNPNMLTKWTTPRQRISLISIAAVFHVSFFPSVDVEVRYKQPPFPTQLKTFHSCTVL